MPNRLPSRTIVPLLAATTLCLGLGTGRAQSDPAAPAPSKGAATVDALTLQRAIQGVVEKGYPFVVTVTAHEKVQAIVSDANGAQSRSAAGNWVRDVASDDVPGHRPLRSCSGFVVGEGGEILTCRSLLLNASGELADVITAETKDGRNTICEIIATEPTLDLALLRFEVYPKGCPPKFGVGKFGDSTSLRPGHLAFAVGDPHGPEVFFGTGVISSLPSRECYQEQITATYLQTTMVLHPEAYGGPLLNLEGEIVGMMIPRTRPSGPSGLAGAELDATRPQIMGIEFALPSNIITTIYHVLATRKSVRSPWLGIAIMSRAELLKERGSEAFAALKKPGFGVWIENTFDPSPAQACGVQSGDFLVKFDGRPVLDPVTFQRLLYLAGIGTEVKLELVRDGQTYERTMKVTERPADAVTR